MREKGERREDIGEKEGGEKGEWRGVEEQRTEEDEIGEGEYTSLMAL